MVSGYPLIIFFIYLKKGLKMNCELNITKNFKNMNDCEKELLRSQLEKKLQTYVKEKYGIYYNIVVNLSSGIYRKFSEDLIIFILYDQDIFNLGTISNDVRSLYETLLSDIDYDIRDISFFDYYKLEFQNKIFKTIPIPDEFFDINDVCIDDDDGRSMFDYKFTNTFLFQNNLLCLNTGYMEYPYKCKPLEELSNRKLFPLLHINLSQFSDIQPIYCNLKQFTPSDSGDNHVLKYINTQSKYINKIDVNELYNSLKQINPQMLFFFNYLFHTIHNIELDLCIFKINTPNDKEISFSCKNRSKWKNINISLSFDKNSTEITAIIELDNRVIDYSGIRDYKFLISDSLFAYRYHTNKILKEIEFLKNLPKNKNSDSQVDGELEEEISESK